VDSAEPHRAGFIALGGRTNVGKSTLLNRMVGHKVAIVTPRPQTTRRRIVGIRREPDAELILIDMPGLHQAHKPINQRMIAIARQCLGEGEVMVAIVEAGERLHAGDCEFLRELLDSPTFAHRPVIVAINKIDLMPKTALLPLVQECHLLIPRAEIVPISALSGDNIDELVRTIKPMLPASPPLMAEDQYTDQTERMIAEEIVREKIFLEMRQEIPFSTAVKVEEFTEDAARKLVRIAATVVVERESHKGMLIGAGGQKLKAIGRAARLELEDLLGSHIFLGLNVKIDKDWTHDPRKLAEFGL